MSRLEEIKARKHLLESNGYDLSYTNEDIDWLIEQAEQVQELKEKHKEYVSFVESNNHSMDADLEKLYKQNKRYREALTYVTKAHIEQYHDLENMLEDIKFIVNKTLEDESK